MNTTTKQVLSALAVTTALLSGALSVSAQTTTTTGTSTKQQLKLSQTMTTQKARGLKEITRRIDSLNQLVTRIGDMKNVSDTDKSTLTTSVQSLITNLNTLQTKIQADADEATIKTDLQSITASYRIFALVLPQTRILAATDRLITLANSMTTIGTKLQARITAAQSAGKDVTALQTTLSDFTAKITDANTQAAAAKNHVVSLTPDNGDKTLMAANTAALKQARADLQVGQQDIVAARKDANSILKGVRAFNLPGSATSTNPQ